MRVVELATDDPAWKAALAGLEHDIYHLPGWTRASAVIDVGDPAAIFVEDGGSQVLIPIVVREVPDDSGHLDATSPYGYGSPTRSPDAPDAFVDEALQAATDHLRSRGVISWFIRLHPLLDPLWQPAIGTTVEHGETVSIDLRSPEEEYRKQLRGSHRREINRALREGVEVLHDTGLNDLGGFVDLYRLTMERVGAGSYYFFPDDYFRELSSLGEHLQLWLASYEGVVIAGAMIGVVPQTGIMQYHLSAADPEHRSRFPTKLLLDRVRSWGAAEGLHRFHLGGGLGAEDDALLRFKGGFSPDRHHFRTLRIRVAPALYEDACSAQGQPAGDDNGFFPAYRIPPRT